MAALARRSPSARLYSIVPRSSQWPSIRRSWSGFALSQTALWSRILASPGRMTALSKSKCTSASAAFAVYSFGGAGGGVGAAAGGGGGAGGAPGAGGGATGAGGEGGGGAAAGGAAGAGAEAAVVAGRFGHPARNSAMARHDNRSTTGRNGLCMNILLTRLFDSSSLCRAQRRATRPAPSVLARLIPPPGGSRYLHFSGIRGATSMRSPTFLS